MYNLRFWLLLWLGSCNLYQDIAQLIAFDYVLQNGIPDGNHFQVQKVSFMQDYLLGWRSVDLGTKLNVSNVW